MRIMVLAVLAMTASAAMADDIEDAHRQAIDQTTGRIPAVRIVRETALPHPA